MTCYTSYCMCDTPMSPWNVCVCKSEKNVSVGKWFCSPNICPQETLYCTQSGSTNPHNTWYRMEVTRPSGGDMYESHFTSKVQDFELSLTADSFCSLQCPSQNAVERLKFRTELLAPMLHIWNVTDWSVSPEADFAVWTACDCTWFLHTNAGTVLKLGHKHFLSVP